MRLENDSRFKRRLVRSLGEAMERMEKMRNRRREFVAEYIAGQLDERWSLALNIPQVEGRRPFNMLHQGVSTVVPHLTGSEPVAKFVPKRIGMEAPAYLMSEALMHLNREQKMLRVFRRVVMDAMFGPGIMFTHIDLSGSEADDQVQFDPMEVFTRRISPDDYVLDASCRHRDERLFEGHTSRGRREMMLAMGFPDEFVEAMPDFRERHEGEGTLFSDINHENANSEDADALGDHGYYTQIWLPHEKVFVYVPGFRQQDLSVNLPMVIQDYYGPDAGPYTVLGFDEAPDYPLPIAPVGIWMDMHLAVNLMAGRIIHNAKVMKQLLLVENEAKDEADMVRTAPDNGVVPVRDPSKFNMVQFGGLSNDTTNAFQLFQRLSSAIQGNSDFLGGIKSSAKTATEAEMLSAAGNVRLVDMQGMVEHAVRDACEVRAWHIFPGNNPDANMPLHTMVNNVMLFLPFNADVVSGEFTSMHFDIEVGSMLKKDERQETIDKMDHGQLILQALEMEMMSGGRFNAEEFIRITGRNVWKPGELERVFRSTDTMLNQMLGAQPNVQIQQQAQMGTRLGQVANRPGRPGRPGMPGRLQTGSASRNYDTGEIASGTREAMME